jgi:hypothetical protein
MKFHLPVLLLFFLLTSLASAEPIRFKPGAASAIVSGTNAKSVEVGAAEGQHMMVKLKSSDGSHRFNVIWSSGMEPHEMTGAETVWMGELPVNTTYSINVWGTEGKPYKLFVAVY